MVFGSIASSPLGSLNPKQALQLANLYLDNAYNTNDPAITLVLCHDTEISLSHARKVVKHAKNTVVVEGMATTYIDLGKLLEKHGHDFQAQTSYKKAAKLGGNVQDSGRSTRSSRRSDITPSGTSVTGSLHMPESAINPPIDQHRQQDVMAVLANVFTRNVRLPAIEFKLPEADERINNTPQLAYCLSLLRSPCSTDEYESTVYSWLQTTEKDTDEQERLHTMATEVIRMFKRDELKDSRAVAEVVSLAPVLNKDEFQGLLGDFYSGIDHSGLLNFHQLEGLAQLIQGADPGHLYADDLVRMLGLLSNRLKGTHQQSTQHMHQLTLAVSHVLDAMADTGVNDLDRETLHEPLSNYLGELKESSDPFLVYQAAYAYQALLCIPDNETPWQAAMRRTGSVIQGVAGLVSAVKGFDLSKFIDGLSDIQKGFDGVSKVVKAVQSAYDDVSMLAKSGQGFMESLKEGFSFERKRDWYAALRGADVLIRTGELATLKELVCKAPCRRDPAFQWGVCQRLGEIATNPMWDADARRDAITFLGEIYRNDEVWGQLPSVKQWILNILMQLSRSPGTGFQLHASVAEAMLRELEANGDNKKQELYQTSRQKSLISYPLKIALPELASPSLLDRVQNRPDVEGSLRLLKKQRTKDRGNAVYIPPQAKADLQTTDDLRFPLMERVKEFLDSDQKVFLLLGESGAGKSTFSRELEFELWQSFKNKSGRIPLHINLPAIDKPENDMIAKQLRRYEFSESQIREMKHYRKFILICDGYDESQQTHNLYMSNQLNQTGEWDAHMVISCRSEYLGIDYRDRFQPGDRNKQSDSSLFQEAVIAPFSVDQVQAYIHQYVLVNQPLWQVEDYNQALKLIPTLKELVANPFLMTLSLEVLPRMVDPGQNLSSTRVTRVGLYDHFVEQWLERGKKRLGEKDLNLQARAAFESLSDEGFTRNGMEYLKKLAVAIYKEQGGHSIVEYSRFIDEGSWKDIFFGREDKQLLREACPLTRTGDQHRFIHRSLLEYGLARSIFDPQDRRNRTSSETTMGRRGSVSSTLSFEIYGDTQESDGTLEQEPDTNSPLVWRSFVNDHSLLQFLEERVQQEPVFKQQLYAYIEHSKKDKKWRVAAANAITILVRAGVQFNGADLQGIQIPGADLSYGLFDSANLQDTDLRKANLRSIWMQHTNLSRAQMTGVQFGELPYLTEEDSVRSCAYSADGKVFAVGLGNGDINVYKTSNWERIRTLKGHINVVWRVVYSPGGDRIASAGEDKTVRLWDSETGSLQHTLTGHTHGIHCAAYSPQGDSIASACDDSTIRVWDVVTGICSRRLCGHTKGVWCVAYSPDGQQIASCSADCTIRLWNVKTGLFSRILSGHSDWVLEIAYSPQGDQLASASKDKTVRLWDMESGSCRSVLDGHTKAVECIAYSPNGDHIASGSVDTTVRLWNIESGNCQQTLTGHDFGIFGIAFSPKGDQIASTSRDKTVRLWDISAHDSRFVFSGHMRVVNSVKCSSKAGLVASGSDDKTVRVWDLETGALRCILNGSGGPVYCIAYSPHGNQIASGGGGRSVRIWDVESRTCLHTLTGHRENINGVAYSPRESVVASASDDMTVRLWDTATGDCQRTLEGHTDAVMSVVYSPSADKIASGSKDCVVRIWDTGVGECCHILVGHTDWARDVSFSPQGNQLASSSYDKTIRLWDVETGECRMTLIGHSDKIRPIAYSQQGDLLASGSWDGEVRIWDVSTGECKAKVPSSQKSVNSLTWSAASGVNHLITGCDSILKWEITNEEDQCCVRLLWGATKGALTMTGASIQNVRGLSSLNKQLLKQRGAIGEPENLLHEKSKKLITIASVVSNLKHSPSITVGDSSSASNVPTEQPEQAEQSGEHSDHT